MRVLVVGSGGREHALVWKLAQSPDVKEIFCAPGNPGIAQLATCLPIGVTDIVELADFAETMKVDLTVVGPELPLTLGLVDELAKRQLLAFGPNKLAAELEGSKVFSKAFMHKYEIPTPEAEVCTTRAEAEKAIKALRRCRASSRRTASPPARASSSSATRATGTRRSSSSSASGSSGARGTGS